jgi:hypothetical protein
LYVSNAALKTDTKLECVVVLVDVEGTEDMAVRGEEIRGAISLYK